MTFTSAELENSELLARVEALVQEVDRLKVTSRELIEARIAIKKQGALIGNLMKALRTMKRRLNEQ